MRTPIMVRSISGLVVTTYWNIVKDTARAYNAASHGSSSDGLGFVVKTYRYQNIVEDTARGYSSARHWRY